MGAAAPRNFRGQNLENEKIPDISRPGPGPLALLLYSLGPLQAVGDREHENLFRDLSVTGPLFLKPYHLPAPALVSSTFCVRLCVCVCACACVCVCARIRYTVSLTIKSKLPHSMGMIYFIGLGISVFLRHKLLY